MLFNLKNGFWCCLIIKLACLYQYNVLKRLLKVNERRVLCTTCKNTCFALFSMLCPPAVSKIPNLANQKKIQFQSNVLKPTQFAFNTLPACPSVKISAPRQKNIFKRKYPQNVVLHIIISFRLLYSLAQH